MIKIMIGCAFRSATQYAAAHWIDELLMTYRTERVAIEAARRHHAVVDDFYRARDDLDRTQFDRMRQSVQDMRDRYAAIHDVVTKNWRSLRQQRSAETVHYH